MRLPMNTSLATLKPSGIRRINALAAQHPGCIALALRASPIFPRPNVISAEVTAALDHVVTRTIRPTTVAPPCVKRYLPIWGTRAWRFPPMRSS